MININDGVLDKDVCGVYNCRPSYRQDYDLDYSGPGDYTIRGFLSRPDLTDGWADGRSYYGRQYPGYTGYYGRTGVSPSVSGVTV